MGSGKNWFLPLFSVICVIFHWQELDLAIQKMFQFGLKVTYGEWQELVLATFFNICQCPLARTGSCHFFSDLKHVSMVARTKDNFCLFEVASTSSCHFFHVKSGKNRGKNHF